MNDTQINIIVTSSHMDLVRARWLHAKSKKSGSAKTVSTYMNTLDQFRAALAPEY